MNDTIKKFNYPLTLLRDYTHWVVLLRPNQITLGSLILALKTDSESLADVSAEAFLELSIITNEIENTLKSHFDFDKINYLLYMMIDKHVHFHIIPRYSKNKFFNGIEFEDIYWPNPPKMSEHIKLSDSNFERLKLFLLENWQR